MIARLHLASAKFARQTRAVAIGGAPIRQTARYLRQQHLAEEELKRDGMFCNIAANNVLWNGNNIAAIFYFGGDLPCGCRLRTAELKGEISAEKSICGLRQRPQAFVNIWMR